MQPRLQLNRRMRDLGLTATKGDTGTTQTLNPRQRRIQQRLHDLEKKQKYRSKTIQKFDTLCVVKLKLKL